MKTTKSKVIQLELPFHNERSVLIPNEFRSMTNEELVNYIIQYSDVKAEFIDALEIIRKLIKEKNTLISMVNPIGKQLLQDTAIKPVKTEMFDLPLN